MEDYKKLLERLREEPKDSRKAVLSIYDLCVDASCAIETLLDKLKYAEAERDVVSKRMMELEEQNAALRQQEHFRDVTKMVPTKNEPLTLDELREMDGDPVWTVTIGVSGSGRWELCTCETVCACPLTKVLRCVTADGEVTDYDLDTYGKTWLAYRQKPEERTV